MVSTPTNRMMRLSIYRAYIAVAILMMYACGKTRTDNKPNVIIIVADDLGYGGLSCYGDRNVRTPHIDDLAANGLKFTDFHSNAPVCTPTRAALLTGRYQQRSGMEGVIYVRGETRSLGLDTAELTIAELMQQNGYATGLMGKWHLGYKNEFNPIYHGFDEFHGYLSGNIDYHSHYDNAGIYDWWHNTDSVYEEGYSTDLITNHAEKFIERHAAEPFFLMVTHEAPHVPLQGRNDPPYRFPGKSFPYQGMTANVSATYKEMVEVMDEGVGRIIAALKAYHLEEKTLVLFISDNGAEPIGNNGILNGAKGSLLEGGHRVPAIAYWKGRISPRESSETLLTMDVLPTVLSLCNARTPLSVVFDGIDFSSILFDGKGASARRTVFWRYNKQKAVRNDKWKLWIDQADTALFNLESDLREIKDVSGDHPDIKTQLGDALIKWERSVGQPEAMKTL